MFLVKREMAASLLSFSRSSGTIKLPVVVSSKTKTKTTQPLFFFDRKTFILAAAASMSKYEKELAAAKKAASLAARLCQKVQKALLQSDVQSKSDKSPVTVADYGSQALVSFVLRRELLGDSFSLVAEEDSADLRKDGGQETLERITKLINETLSSDGSYDISPLSGEDVLTAIDSGKSEGGPSGRHWVLDPIDGTKGFVRGDQYAIALGLLDEGKVVLGVLACPNLPLAPIGNNEQDPLQNQVGCLFSAEVGSGTLMQSLDGSSSTKVRVSSTENPAEASFFESFEAAHSLHDLSSSIAKKLGVEAPPVRIDSQAKYGALSRGDGAIYLRFPHKGYREKIWDHAAGCIVVTGITFSRFSLASISMEVRMAKMEVKMTKLGSLKCMMKLLLRNKGKHVVVQSESDKEVAINPFADANNEENNVEKNVQEEPESNNTQEKEAGGIVTDAGGNPLDFSKGRFLDLDTGIIVTNQKLMPLLLKAVRDSLSESSQATPSL